MQIFTCNFRRVSVAISSLRSGINLDIPTENSQKTLAFLNMLKTRIRSSTRPFCAPGRLMVTEVREPTNFFQKLRGAIFSAFAFRSFCRGAELSGPMNGPQQGKITGYPRQLVPGNIRLNLPAGLVPFRHR